MSGWADLPPAASEGRKAFVAMLTATVHDDYQTASNIMSTLDPDVIVAALVVAVGTAAVTISALFDGDEVAMTADEYVAEMGLMAAQDPS